MFCEDAHTAVYEVMSECFIILSDKTNIMDGQKCAADSFD